MQRLQRPFFLQLRQVLGHGLQPKLLRREETPRESVEKPLDNPWKNGEKPGKPWKILGKTEKSLKKPETSCKNTGFSWFFTVRKLVLTIV
jgi:hypothetical protein